MTAHPTPTPSYQGPERRAAAQASQMLVPIWWVYVIVVSILGTAIGGAWFMSDLAHDVRDHGKRLGDLEELTREIVKDKAVKVEVSSVIEAFKRDQTDRQTRYEKNMESTQAMVQSMNDKLIRIDMILTYAGKQPQPDPALLSALPLSSPLTPKR